jgi:UV DNA damage endonuclease
LGVNREAAQSSVIDMKASGKERSQLGLVCITASEEVRYRTMTRKRLLQLDVVEQKSALRGLYAENLSRLDAAIDYCQAHDIRLYRLTSSLFPFADDPIGEDVLEEFSEVVAAKGQRALDSGIRLVLHPDQFVVLSSDSPQVVENSIKILETHARVMDMLKQPRSCWAVIEIHGGKSGRSEQLVKVISQFPEAIRTRLALENDEYSYSALEILEVCRAARVPMVFDAHHHIVHEKLDSYEDPSIARMLGEARKTWPVPAWQMVHISNGREFFNDRHHSDLITVMPSAYRKAPWIEVEAKHKELAIEKLRNESAHALAGQTGI